MAGLEALLVELVGQAGCFEGAVWQHLRTGVARLERLQATWLRIVRWNRRVAVKREVLGDATTRSELRKHLGGTGALAAWEQRAEAWRDTSYVPRRYYRDKQVNKERYRAELEDWQGLEEFRLATVPGKARTFSVSPALRRGLEGGEESERASPCCGGQTGGGPYPHGLRARGPGAGAGDTGRRRGKRRTRIPVWPCELATRAERRAGRYGVGRRKREQTRRRHAQEWGGHAVRVRCPVLRRTSTRCRGSPGW